MVKDTLNQAETKMKKAVEALRHHLNSIRTGRASPALVEHLHVEYYGSEMPLNQLANISAPEARMLVIQPWDKGAMKAIEKAIQNSDLGLNPNNDGQVIRLSIPQLTEQRRKDLVKLVKKEVEEQKVSLRNVRRDGQTDLKKLESDKQISEDELKRAQEKLEQLTAQYTKELDQVGQTKEQEVLEV
ncbi:MAG: ribosome recycling factor [Chloroflexi bacterium]|nr:ribosome recycling factor [Chloroflexota bacterium]